MRSVVILSVLLLTQLVLSACSALTKSAWLQAEEQNEQWHYNSKRKAAEFRYGDAVVRVLNADLGGKTLFVGPPLLPFIPWLANTRVFVSIGIHIQVVSTTVPLALDLEKVTLTIPEQKNALLPWKIYEYPFNVNAPPFNPIQTVEQQDKTFFLQFKVNRADYINRWDADFVLNIGTIQFVGQPIQVPQLPLNKHSRYHYVPFYLRGH